MEFETYYMVITNKRLFLFDISDIKALKMVFCGNFSQIGDLGLRSKLYLPEKNLKSDIGCFVLFCE
jgi:hypothetical protein